VKFANNEIDVLRPRGPCYLTKGGNADADERMSVGGSFSDGGL
jgi:hypothetical protein